jgi:ankyrin repeat protein
MPNERLGLAAADDEQAPPPLPSPERIQQLLFDAARLGREEMIAALLQAGADVTAVDPNGHSALILASYHGHEAATALLLQHGSIVDQPDQARGNTALMGVAFKGHDAIAELLLDAGADPDATNLAGQTALMMAALFGHGAIVDRLLERGCDPQLQDAAGNSAVSVARSQCNDAMVARLEARLPEATPSRPAASRRTWSKPPRSSSIRTWKVARC